MDLPQLPCSFESFIPYLETNAKSSREVNAVIEPFRKYEAKLRQIYAQQPDHPLTEQNHLVPVFGGKEYLSIKARKLDHEDDAEKESFLLTLSDEERKESGSPAIVKSLEDFRTNLGIFSESSLSDLDWSNVVVSGSAVLTSLLPVNAPYNASKRAHRVYYHEKLAPASDVDLFLYGLNEEQAIEKIKKIEKAVRDSVLAETTTIRTKNAITIVSEYPTRHVQIVLRLYKSISEILTGFDVDCACVAFDGKQVWASPRALGALTTQINSIDLTRRSPSYENRLSKYSHRGFEVCWPGLDRSRIDPTIYERSFSRVVGLARLLVLEKLPHPSDRDKFLNQRREERGRPQLPWNARYAHQLHGNVKDAQPDDVAEWYEEIDESAYHTFTIPYGPKFTARKIEKLLFKKDLLLNAEWNRPKERETVLHRHPAFFGLAEDIIGDCCGFCPEPVSDADLAAYEAESRLYISGEIKFIKDDPGRQTIGSFRPITDGDWADMAYVGNTAQLCQSIVDKDMEGVQNWFATGGDVNQRDHTGRTPLHLAVMTSTPEIVQCLVDRGARITWRIYSGMTALHMAAHRGVAEIVSILLDKSTANEEEENRKEDLRREARRMTTINQNAKNIIQESVSDDDGVETDEEFEEDQPSDAESVVAVSEGSFVKLEAKSQEAESEDDTDGPDFYNVNVLAWDNPLSPLHMAIIFGHDEIVTLLVETYGADVLLPVKLMSDHIPRQPRAVILTLTLACYLPWKQTRHMIGILLSHGASLAQGDALGATALEYLIKANKSRILDLLTEDQAQTVTELINHVSLTSSGYEGQKVCTPLTVAITKGSVEAAKKLLAMGASPEISFESYTRAVKSKSDPETARSDYDQNVTQPIVQAARWPHLVEVVDDLIEQGCNVNTMTSNGYRAVKHQYPNYDSFTVLDCIRKSIKALKEYTEGSLGEAQYLKPEALPIEAGQSEATGQYQTWLLRSNLALARDVLAAQTKAYEDEVEARHRDSENKKRDIPEKAWVLLSRLIEVEERLVQKGAKTFSELHPTLDRKGHNIVFNYNETSFGREPYENKLTFIVPEMTETKRAKYLELFEAAFLGDTEKVTALCLAEHNDELPLQVAVQDLVGFSPFSLALARGHQKLAKTIFEIVAAQYEPEEDNSGYARYTLKINGDLDDSDSDHDQDEGDGNIQIYKELVEKKFTIEDVRLLAKNVKSKVSPMQMLDWNCEIWRLLDRKDIKPAKESFQFAEQTTHHGHRQHRLHPWSRFHEMMRKEQDQCRGSLDRYAIHQNDISMMRFILHTRRQFKLEHMDDESFERPQFNDYDLNFALKLGRTELLREIIEQTGALMPLNDLAQQSGLKIEERPKYYQGLTVHGKKRKDWANADRGIHSSTSRINDASPVLTAILAGNLAAVEFFLSDTPLRHYERFIAANKHDKRIEMLDRAEGGTERALQTWMNTRINLALHLGIIACPEDDTSLVEYLIRKIPQFVNARSELGLTPLLVAFKLKRYDLAKLLITAGANQECRNKNGENIMHIVYSHCADLEQTVGHFEMIVSLLDAKIAQDLLLQRTSTSSGSPGYQTPLAKYCDLVSTDKGLTLLDGMLRLSKGKDLYLMDGAGDYVPHRSIRCDKAWLADHIGSKFPELLLWENATGMTPIEVAEIAFLKGVMDHPPEALSFSYKRNYSIWRNSIETDLQPELEKVESSELDTIHRLRAYVAEAPATRKLVSLLDANEIARRLAEEQKREKVKQREAQASTLELEKREFDSIQDGPAKDEVDEAFMSPRDLVARRKLAQIF